jgi:Holliday junction resolvasome RuvABC endonuclease subunit
LIEPQQKEHDSPETRYLAIADWTISILVSNRVEEVVLEGYALGASAGLVFNIAENTSVLKQKLRAAGIKFTTPSPSVAKKRLSGKGNSKKPDMCQAFTDKFGVSLSATLGCKPGDTPENDLVDATANLMTHPMLVNS